MTISMWATDNFGLLLTHVYRLEYKFTNCYKGSKYLQHSAYWNWKKILILFLMQFLNFFIPLNCKNTFKIQAFLQYRVLTFKLIQKCIHAFAFVYNEYIQEC
jgi:hypothetical protein